MAFGRRRLSPNEVAKKNKDAAKKKLDAITLGTKIKVDGDLVYKRGYKGLFSTGGVNKKVMRAMEQRYLYVIKEAIDGKVPQLQSGLSSSQYTYLVSAVTLPVVTDFASRKPVAALEFTKEFGVERTAELINAMNKGVNIEKAIKKGELESAKLRDTIFLLGANDTVLLIEKIGVENFKILLAKLGPEGVMELLKESGYKFTRQRAEFLNSKMRFVKKALSEKWSLEEITDQLHTEAVSQRHKERKRD